ncbi:SusC/RagA family TonB-linked outer membrane protein [Flavitalea flava]
MGSSKRLAYLLLLICLLQGFIVHGQSGNPLVSLSVKNASLESVLQIIEKQTGYTPLGNTNLFLATKPVTLEVINMPLNEVLDRCFRDQPLTYKLAGNHISYLGKETETINIAGKILDEKDEPLPGVSVQLKGGKPVSGIASKEDGSFRLQLDKSHSLSNIILIISSINFEPVEWPWIEGKENRIHLQRKVSQLGHAEVIVNTGFQRIPKERATGAFAKMDNELVTRNISPNILDRMEGVVSGVATNKNIVNGTNQSVVTIRGRSTIYGNPDPLIVIDNFPYNGDINNINPDDVESITVLKDAAAASIWGAFSGNGVIVITTKKGKFNQAPKLVFNTSQTIGNKPDLYYKRIMPSADYIQVEEYLFDKRFYDGKENSPTHLVLTPAVEILFKQRHMQIGSDEANAQLYALGQLDTRNDLDRYFYRHSLNSQYSMNLSGGAQRNQYYLSAGYDRDQANLVRNEYNRVTLNGNNTYSLISQKLELSTSFAFTSSKTYNNNIGSSGVIYPYASLADPHGNPLAVNYLLRQGYVDTVGGGKLLDWNYRPLDELRKADNITRLTDYRINIGIKYTILKGMEANAFYQYGRTSSDNQSFKSQQTYFTRNLINQYSQPDSSGNVYRPIPLGGILDKNLRTVQANNIRFQLNFDHIWGDHTLNAIGGVELRDIEGQTAISRFYGYNKDQETSQAVNYTTLFNQYTTPGNPIKIPFPDQNFGTTDRFLSYYANASYSYLQRYTLSGSARRDESNLFGVKANQKGVPLWSVGAAWEISREHFYTSRWLPFLKLRVTEGYNGNVDRNVSAFTTAVIDPGTNSYGVPSISIVNPPNPSLRWERINIFNAAVDFSSKNNRIEGSLDYFIKIGQDLIGQSPLDPTTGNVQFTGNTANMIAKGVDMVISTKNTKGLFQWNTVLLFSFVRDRVTNYRDSLSTVGAYFNTISINPLVGRPLYSVYGLKWMGLDLQYGAPQGLLNGHVSEDYPSIYNSSNLHDLVFKGPANPPFFGSVRNSFSWKQWGLSFNILYKFGYFFRRASINYSDLFKGLSGGHPDFINRWQKSGDEKITGIPSMSFPLNPASDNFYTASEILIEKGDHIRLQDIQVYYDLVKKKFPRLPVQSIRFYLYANNIGIIWKANHQGIDPDYVSDIPNPRSLAIGLKLDL